jgi:hypothetical protein
MFKVVRRMEIRFQHLIKIMDDILFGLRRGVHEMLYGVRYICKQLDLMARTKFGDPRASVAAEENIDGNQSSNKKVNEVVADNGDVAAVVASDDNDVAAAAHYIEDGTHASNESFVDVGEDERFNGCASEKQITAIVCGFLVLRFLNPMLLAPDTCHLVNTQVSKVCSYMLSVLGLSQ